MSKVFVIAQGGGPTAVINQTVAGAALAVRERHPGSRVLGARHGVRGVAGADFVDLSALSEAELMRFANTPNSGLGSTRDKPDEAYCGRILDGLGKVAADAFIYIGGNDTSGTLAILDRAAAGKIHFIHAPKTIDNDLAENDHTPGFISAALFVANAFLSVDLDFRAMRGVYIGIVMGRHAGFLTAASATWRRDDTDGPHLIYVPEVPFTEQRLMEDIRATYERYGRCVVAMSEGVQTADHKPWRRALSRRTSMSATPTATCSFPAATLASPSRRRSRTTCPGVRARVDTFGYLPRGFIGTISETDRTEAFAIGGFAVEQSEAGSGSVAQQYADGKTVLKMVPLDAVANKTKTMPADFLTPAGNHLTETGLAYFRRLLPPRPDVWTPFV